MAYFHKHLCLSYIFQEREIQTLTSFGSTSATDTKNIIKVLTLWKTVSVSYHLASSSISEYGAAVAILQAYSVWNSRAAGTTPIAWGRT